jgi:endonuclease/exonuclease/phosphatase (EEP) superfamily protein YafD
MRAVYEQAGKLLRLQLQPPDVVMVLGVVLCLATLLAFLGGLWWLFDLFAPFRIQYLVGLVLAAAVLLFTKRRRTSGIFALFALINLALIAPLYFGAEPGPPVTSRPYRAVLVNVNTDSGDPGKVAESIRQLAPDLIVLEEVSDAWLASLSAALAEYPHSETMPRDDNFGIGLFSKHPLVRSGIVYVGEAEVPSIVAEVQLPDGLITVIGTHPLPPVGKEKHGLRNEQLARLPEIVKRATSPVLLLGDLNATPWCSPFKSLLSESGLRDSARGRGVLGTWPTSLPIFLIPIDHCLHSAEIHITRRALGPRTGSDHYPLLVDFVLASAHSPPIARSQE